MRPIFAAVDAIRGLFFCRVLGFRLNAWSFSLPPAGLQSNGTEYIPAPLPQTNSLNLIFTRVMYVFVLLIMYHCSMLWIRKIDNCLMCDFRFGFCLFLFFAPSSMMTFICTLIPSGLNKLFDLYSAFVLELRRLLS